MITAILPPLFANGNKKKNAHQVSHRSGRNFSASGNILGSQLAALVRNPT